MSLNETSSIRFSVEESVWFKKGQEVDNLVSMSLDPEITVQESEDYISIRGALVLTGEYYPNESEQEEQGDISLRESGAKRTIDEIVQTEDGLNNINHRFPVDITIPANRIKSLDDVYVLIDSFDYEMPNKGQLQLTADLSISGIVNEREEARTDETNEILNEKSESNPSYEISAAPVIEEPDSDTPKVDRPTVPEPVAASREGNREDSEEVTQASEAKFPTFYTEARKEPTIEEQKSVENKREEAQEKVNPIPSPVDEEQEQEQEVPQLVEMREQQDEDLDKPEEEETVEEAFELQEDRQDEELEEEAQEKVIHTAPTPQIEMKGRAEDEGFGWNPNKLYNVDSEESTDELEEANASAEQNNEERPRPRSENALYLTKMLASNGEEDFSKLRMRIVQDGETLGSIAESYDVSPNSIMRMNNLEDDVVEEGQILYIPEYAGID